MAKKQLIALLERGYFPEELPPPFTTSHFAALVDSGLTAYRNDVDKVLGSDWTDYSRHNLPRCGRIRRVLGIVHPKHFFRIADLVQKHWTDIDRSVRQSKLTKTAPIWGDVHERAIIRESGFDDRSGFRAHICHGTRFLLQTDVERCFPSIYTHSIPWAIHGKRVCKSAFARKKKKKTRAKRLFGNDLDIQIRSAQDGQTIGIPIGPDTSRVISELVLSAVDLSMPKTLMRDSFRFVDDYEFACDSAEKADDCFTKFHEALSKYELAPNLRKTNTYQMPVNFDSPWAIELRNFPLADSARRTKLNERYFLEEFFELVTKLSKEYRNESVIKYGTGKLLQIAILHRENWRFLLTTAAGFVVDDPSCIGNVLILHKKFRDKGYPAYKQILGRALNAVIRREAPLRHSSYVAWAIWACLVLEIRITRVNARALQEIDDVVVALLTLHANRKGLLSGAPRFSNWKTFMTREDLDDRMWLLAYEARYKSWLPTHGGGDHIAGHPLFEYLRKKDVHFYEESTVSDWQNKSASELRGMAARRAYSD